MADLFSVEWLREHVTLYADDFHLAFTFSEEDGLIKALKDLRVFLDKMGEYGLQVNMEKTAFLMHLRGRSEKWRAKLIRGTGSQAKIKLSSVNRQGESLMIPLHEEHKYLGIMLGYRSCQKATLKLRMAAASGTFARLRRWWGSGFPLQARVKLWYQTVWPTLTYGLNEVGLSSKDHDRFGAFVFRHRRRLAKSPLHMTRESNENLCRRLGILHPCDHLCATVFRLWERRLDRLRFHPETDVLHMQVAQCTQAASFDFLLKPWWSICLNSWQKTGLIKMMDDHPVMHLLHLKATQAPLESITPEPTQMPTSEAHLFYCALCEKQFANQMAYRQHLRHAHEPAPPSNLRFSIVLDSVGGVPTCRYCKAKFRFWQGLKQHLDKDTCIMRDVRAHTHSTADLKSTSLEMNVIEEIQKMGAEEVLMSQSELFMTLSHTCVLCSKWCATGGALSRHLSRDHPREYARGLGWTTHRLKSKVLLVHNPCTWCSQSFSQKSILQKHFCAVTVQIGIFASAMVDFDNGATFASAASAATTSATAAAAANTFSTATSHARTVGADAALSAGSRRGTRSLSRHATKHGKGWRHERQHEERPTRSDLLEPGRSLSGRTPSSHLARAMFLCRAQAKDQALGGASTYQHGVQQVPGGEDDHGQRLLLQDGLGCALAKDQAHVSGPRDQRCVPQVGNGGGGVQVSSACSSLSLIEADGAGLPRQEHNILPGAEHQAGCCTWTPSTRHVAKVTFDQQPARIHRDTLSAVSAFRTWMQHGRDDVPVPLLENPDNICYCNATIAALVACYHHHHRHLPLHDLRADPALEEQWGFIGDIVAAAVSDWTSLWHVPSFLLALAKWEDVHRQHDAAEFLECISASIPLLTKPQPKSRILMQAGIDEVMEEQAAQLGLHVIHDGESLACCLRRWEEDQGAIQALSCSPLVLSLPIARFEYANRQLHRANAKLSIEPSEIAVPVYVRDACLARQYVRYKIVACTLHTGPTPTSGHYRALIATDGGYVISDDHRWSEYFANPPEHELANITQVYLLRNDCFSGF